MHTLNFKMKTIKTSATLCVSLLILSIVLVIKSHMKLSILNNEDVILNIPPLTQMLDFMSLIDRHSSIDIFQAVWYFSIDWAWVKYQGRPLSFEKSLVSHSNPDYPRKQMDIAQQFLATGFLFTGSDLFIGLWGSRCKCWLPCYAL